MGLPEHIGVSGNAPAVEADFLSFIGRPALHLRPFLNRERRRSVARLNAARIKAG